MSNRLVNLGWERESSLISTMPDSQTLTVDLTRSSDVLQILPRPPLRSSVHLGWQDLYVQQHQQPAWETPEYRQYQHVLLVHTSTDTIRAERMFDGRKQQEQLGGGNNIVIIPSMVEHQANWDRERPFSLLFLDPDRLIRVADEAINTDRVELIPQYAMPDPFIDRIGQALTLELSEDRVSSRLFVDSLTTALAIHLLRHYLNRQQLFLEVSGGLSRQKLQQAIAYIEANLATDLTISALADELELSQYYFSRLFKQSTGISPYRYIIETRIATAKRLLKNTSLSIAEIAVRVGFANQDRLTIQFRNLTGTTPSNYRKQL
jgi:AraC family transcriptional regulator